MDCKMTMTVDQLKEYWLEAAKNQFKGKIPSELMDLTILATTTECDEPKPLTAVTIAIKVK